MALILKRASASRPSSQWSDEHYDELADGKVVGRILESGSRFDPPGLRWTWSITCIVPALSNVTYGTAATREEARAKFRAAWTTAKGGAMAALRRWREQPMSANASAIAPNRT